MQFLNNLQNKPRYIRVQILWISVILIMVIIFSFWVMYLKSSLGVASEEADSEPEKESIPSLFSSLKDDFSFLKDKLKAGVKGVSSEQESKPKFKVEIVK